MVYYFLAYFHVQKSVGASNVPLQFVVPTGNFGDILAGYYAKKMGLPMSGKLGVATNANDILARFWSSGRYEKVDSSSPSHEALDSSGVKETCSPAMDILVSSNFERLLWYLAYENAEDTPNRVVEASQTLAGWMGKMKVNGKVEVSTSVLDSARRDFCAERVSDSKVLSPTQSPLHF
jgi:threonine synthase